MPTTIPITAARRLRRLLSLLLLPAVVLSLFAPAAPVVRAQEPQPPPPPPRYQVQVLEGQQGEYFRAVDLNNRGQVIGTFAARPNDIPELWEDGRFTRLPMLAGELEPFYPQPNALNDAGHVLVRDNRGLHIWLGGSYVTPTRPDPYYWSPSHLSAATLNNQGVVYASIIDYRTYPNRGTAVFWSSGAFGFLPAPSNTGAVITTDLNDANQAVGAYLLQVGNSSVLAGFRYVNNQVQVLTAPNSSYTRPEAINNQSQIVGTAYGAQGLDRPVIWQADGTVADLPIGTAHSGRAIDINDSGEVIGELLGIGPVIWREGGLYRLAELLPAELQLNLSRAVAINNAGQLLVEGAAAGQQARFHLLTPEERPELSIDSVALEHGDYPSAAWIPVPTEGTTDGNIVRVTVSLRNPGDEPVEALLDVAETTTNSEIGFSCPTTITVPPTGSGAPHEVQCTWDTSGFAWDAGRESPVRVLRATLAPVGGTVSTLDTRVVVTPRPLFIIPTISADAPMYETLASTLRQAHSVWDVIPVPGIRHGGASTLTPEPSASLVDNARTLNAFIEGQRDTLNAWRFDLLGHGIGGTVARVYVAVYTNPDPSTGRTSVGRVITLGSPHRGTPCAAVELASNQANGNPNLIAWQQQTPELLARIEAELDPRGVEFLSTGGDGRPLACLTEDENPSTSDSLVPASSATAVGRPLPLVGTAHRLLFLDADIRTMLVNEFARASGPEAAALATATEVTAAAPALPRPAPIAETLSVEVPAGAVVERTINLPAARRLGVSLSGAAGVTATLLTPADMAAATTTLTDSERELLAVTGPEAGQWTLRLSNGSTEIAQVQAIVQLLGASFTATAETGAPEANGNVPLRVALSDLGVPVTGAIVEVLLQGVAQPVALRDDGQSGDGTVSDGIYGTTVAAGSDFAIATVRVTSSAGNRLVPVVLTAGAGAPVTLPEVSAGGPYTVAEGASIALGATGNAGLEYAWDLDGDGVYEAAGQGASFSAASIDGPASRLARVRASDPATGLSATSAALVTVENVAPVATLSAPATATVGQPFTLALTGASDPGGDPLSFAFDCGTGFGQAGSATSASCTPTAAGTLTVRASVADDDGGASEYSATVPVAAAPGGEPSELYRARQVGARVHIERNVALAGLGDYDPDGDGWALVGRTNGAGNNGELRAFTIREGVPYATVFNRSNNKGDRCILVTPRSLDPVHKGQTHLVTTAADPAPCAPEQPAPPTPALCYADGAQSWQDFAPGTRKDGKPVLASRANPALALGLPQQNDTVNFVSLGFGGSLTLRFANPIVNDGTGTADIRVWETSFNDARRAWRSYPEAVQVYASADGASWTLIGTTSDKDQAYDLVLPQAQYLKLVDMSDRARFGSPDDGFDLDAVEVLSGCVRP